jgi:hypothetical protein
MTQFITAEDVVHAFGKSEQFPEGSPQFATFAPYVSQLVEIVGEKYMNNLVDAGSLADVTGRFVGWLINNSSFLDQFYGTKHALLAFHCRQIVAQAAVMARDPEMRLSQLGLTEADVMMSEEVGLNDEAKALYQRGELTFARLLCASPHIFIPEA